MRDEPIPRIPAAFNWTSCRAVSIRGRTTVLMAAPTSTSDERTEQIDADAVGYFSQGSGLRLLSKTARLPDSSPSGTLVITSAGTVARTDETGIAAIESTLGSLPSLPEEVDVVLAFGGPHTGRNPLELLKSASERGLAVGMHARVLDLRPDTPRIDDVGTFIGEGAEGLEWPAVGDRVLLDQNILVSLDSCLQHPNQRLWSHLRDLFGWLAMCDPIPGFAFAECLSAGGDIELAKRLQAAFAVFMNHAHQPATVDHLSAAAAAYVALGDERLDADTNDINQITDMNYLGILHALRVWRALPTEGFVPRDRLAAWEDWLGSVNVDHAGVSAYCRVVVRMLLLLENNGPRDSPGNLAVRLLKVREQPTRKSLRGAAWDLAYLFLADLARAGNTDMSGSGPVVVLTADKPLQGLARAGFLAGIRPSAGGEVGLVMHCREESPKFSDKQVTRITELELMVAEDQERRRWSPWRSRNQMQITADISSLESDLALV